MRFTIRQAMVIVAAVAALVWLAVGLIDFTRSLPDTTGYGPDTSRLSAGQGVVVLGDIRATLASKVIQPTADGRTKSTYFEYQTGAPGGEYALEAGTPGLVKIDPAHDDDDCLPGRLITVQVSAASHTGLVVALPRNRLRRR